jgi:signal transduction histidine kinase
LASEEPLDVFASPPKRASWRGELKALRKDDTELDVEMSASPIIDENDQVIGSMASFVDVTERKRLEAQSIQSHKMEALGFLAGSVAHDFNNILTIVRSYLQVIAMEVASDSQLFKDVMQVKIAVDRGSGITKQLRFFSKETDGEMVPTDLNEMIVESCELLRHLFPPEMKLVLDLEPGLWIVDADLSQLSQVLMNFCVNARDAIGQKEALIRKETPDLEYAGRIELKTKNVRLDDYSASRYLAAKPGQYVCLTTKDNGAGIEKSALERVFEPFFSTKKSNRNSGLGLSIVYGIIQKHDGFIDVKSVPGEGTSFEVYFPAREGLSVEKRASSTVSDIPSAKKRMVLVVDDEPQVITLLKRLLDVCGFNVMVAENGKDAVDLYQEMYLEIDLVILDIIMPEMNGLECVQQMRQINPEVKVIVSTGYTADDSAAQTLKEGAVGLIEKPFDFHTLSKAIKKALRR